jgi:hypothetical protein
MSGKKGSEHSSPWLDSWKFLELKLLNRYHFN